METNQQRVARQVRHGREAINAGVPESDTPETDATDAITNILLACEYAGQRVDYIHRAALSNFEVERDELGDDLTMPSSPSLDSPRVKAVVALRAEAGAREDKAVELEENDEGVYTPSDWKRVRDRALYLRKIADEIETDHAE